MNKDKKNLLVTLADSNFIDQAKQLFSSVYFNSGWEGDYLLLTSGLADKDALWFKEKGILVYDGPVLSREKIGLKKYPAIVLTKFFLFKEYFKSWSTIIFLDADIIVKSSLDNLLASTDFSAPRATFKLKEEFAKDGPVMSKLKDNYSLLEDAFNSGVFVFNTDLIKTDTFAKIISLYDEYGRLNVYGEEATLNLFFYRNWKILPPIYNFAPSYMGRYYGIKKNKVRAIIIHFICEKFKPWNEKSLYYNEWSDNLKKAENINLNNRPKGTRLFKEREQVAYLRFLKLRKVFYVLPNLIDRYIGLVGLVIKKINPKLYKLIRFKKDEK